MIRKFNEHSTIPFEKIYYVEASELGAACKRWYEDNPHNSGYAVVWIVGGDEEQNTDKLQNPKLGDGSDIRRYIGSVCDNCGEMSNHDEIDEDICIHCKTRFGTWKHIYENPSEIDEDSMDDNGSYPEIDRYFIDNGLQIGDKVVIHSVW